MLQAMNTGHDGSLTTIHANTPRDALSRLETMIQMTGMRLSDRAMRQQIASAVNLVIQVARLTDGTRRIVSISEITGMEGEMITMQEIFLFERTGVDATRKGHWPFPYHRHSTAFCGTIETIRNAVAGVLLGGEMFLSLWTLIFFFFLFLTYALFLLALA